jgi:hypothetical protein
MTFVIVRNNLLYYIGGLGIRRISDICLPAFLSSVHGVKKLVSHLLNSKDNELIIHHYDEALAVWDVENENERKFHIFRRIGIISISKE